MTAKIKENESFVTVSKILEILNESEYIGIKNINEYDERKTYALLPVNSENCHLLNYLNTTFSLISKNLSLYAASAIHIISRASIAGMHHTLKN